MKKLIHRFFGVVVAAALLMGSVMPTVAVMAAGDHASDTPITDGKDCDYTITLTKPDGVTVDENAKYGAYQIFSGKVPDENSKTNPGNTNDTLQITDIKWGNAFGTVGDIEWKRNIIKFAIALGTAKNDPTYNYAFVDFGGFEVGGTTPLVRVGATSVSDAVLNQDYVNDLVTNITFSTTSTDDLNKVNYDKLAVAVAQEIERHKDRVWLQAFADILGGYTKSSSQSYVNQYYASAIDKDTYTIKVPAGYYMIIDQTEIGSTENEAYSARMLFVANNVTQVLKEDVPTLDKKIKRAEGTYKDTEVAGVGDVVNFRLTGTLPSNYDNYLGGYQYTFTDRLSTGLTFNENVEVTAEGLFKWNNGKWEWDGTAKVTIPKEYNQDAAKDTGVENHAHHLNASTGNYQPEFKGQEMTVKFECLKEMVLIGDDGVTKYRLGYYDSTPTVDGDGISSKIYVDYSAKVNSNAVIGSTGNSNEAQIKYSNDPQAYDNTDNTPEQVTHVYTFGLDITKVNAAEFLRNGINGADVKLPNAEFALIRKNVDGTYDIAAFENTSGTNYVIKEWKKFSYSGSTNKELQEAIDTYITSYTDAIYQVESGNDGRINISGLDAAVTYTMVEMKTPGTVGQFAKIDPFDITLTAKEGTNEYDGTLDKAESTQNVTAGGSFDFKEHYVEITDPTTVPDTDGSANMLVANFKYVDLPSTGGIGIYPFYIIGGIVVAGSIILFALSRRKKTA